MEKASGIVTYTRNALRLASLGQARLQAALDELDHAQVSFEIASLFTGQDVEPSVLSESQLSFTQNLTALALGAAGVQIGTAFLTCPESAVPPPHRRALENADGSDTQVTRAFSGRPARGVKNRYMEALAPNEDDLPDFPLMNTLTGPLRKASADADSPDMIALWSGQAVGLNRNGSVAEVIERLVEETRSTIAALSAG